MRSRTRASLAIGLVLAFSASVAWAQAPTTPPPTTPPPTTPAPATKPPAAPGNLSTGAPGVVMADVAVINATVEAVDKDKRTVTLKGSGGRTVTLKVGPNAKNFDQIKVGDKVKGKFLDSVALFVRKAGTPPDAAEMQAVSVAPRGQKPKAMTVDTVEISAKVEKIDYKKRLVTLKGPEGNTKTIKVDPRVKRLDEIKVGDDIVLRHTEAMAIEVVSPKS
ncbi:MAG TPA: hypothetical protein VF238_01675 [Methylomirabilota bacterium]